MDENKNRTHIQDAGEKDIYICPLCGGELVKKRGKVKIWHFAHKTLIDCDTWSEMSEWHTGWQSIFKPHHVEVSIIEPEKRHRSDVKCGNVIIEFQHSSLSGDDFDERTEFYRRHGFLVWVFDVREKQIYNAFDHAPDGSFETIRSKTKFIWAYAYKFNGLIYSDRKMDYALFLQRGDDEIIRVTWSSKKSGFKRFDGEVYTVDQFKEYITEQCKIHHKYIYLPNDYRTTLSSG